MFCSVDVFKASFQSQQLQNKITVLFLKMKKQKPKEAKQLLITQDSLTLNPGPLQ